MDTIKIDLGNREIEAETAGKPIAKAKGLRGRTSGKMLFSFNPPSNPGFDMVGVSEPIWIYGLKHNPGGCGELVVSADKLEPWSLDPRTWKMYFPGHKCKYVLESFEELDLEKGDVVHLSSGS